MLMNVVVTSIQSAVNSLVQYYLESLLCGGCVGNISFIVHLSAFEMHTAIKTVFQLGEGNFENAISNYTKNVCGMYEFELFQLYWHMTVYGIYSTSSTCCISCTGVLQTPGSMNVQHNLWKLLTI